MTFKLNRNQLKYLVIVAMLIDHIAWAFVPTVSVLGFVMHFIGRLTGPTMAFFLVEGFEHTRDRKKYLMRLGIFALISWIPFSLFEVGRITYSFGVIYTLFLGLIALMVEETGSGTLEEDTAILHSSDPLALRRLGTLRYHLAGSSLSL